MAVGSSVFIVYQQKYSYHSNLCMISQLDRSFNYKIIIMVSGINVTTVLPAYKKTPKQWGLIFNFILEWDEEMV